jgi:hypothetical protein
MFLKIKEISGFKELEVQNRDLKQKKYRISSYIIFFLSILKIFGHERNPGSGSGRTISVSKVEIFVSERSGNTRIRVQRITKIKKVRLSLSVCPDGYQYTLKKILKRKDQYLYVARRTITNLFLGVVSWNLLRMVPDLTQLSSESIYL